MHLSNRKGMTLAEILIVVAIIGLVATMLIPSFNMAVKKTRRAICINNLRLLQGAADSYCMEQKVSDIIQVSEDDLSNTACLKERVRCPEGNIEYNPFIIRDGPVCPNSGSFPDHKLGD